jgi:ketosteroid isomerase-like protein
MDAAVSHASLVEAFYAAFGRRDWAGMAACYHPDVTFRDEVFRLEGRRAAAMWHMLCEGGKDLRIEASGIAADGDRAKAHWVADYTFSGTGRKVRNAIDAEFRFRDGLIVDHRDAFSFWRWASQALGFTGLLLGWMPRLQQTVQARARANLDKFVQAHPEYA